MDAVAAAPALVRVTLVTASLLTRPEVVNALVPSDRAVPYVLDWLLAVTVSAPFGPTVKVTIYGANVDRVPRDGECP